MKSFVQESGAYPADFANAYDKCLRQFGLNAAHQLYELVSHERHADGASLLDLCCGTGHLCKYFLERGHTTVGLDLSARMLEIAKSNTNEYRDRASWILADASSFDLGQSFGAVASTFSSINLLASDTSVTRVLRMRVSASFEHRDFCV